MSANDRTIKEKRQALLQHASQERNGHDYFRTGNGSHLEGYILEVGETSIVFQWAIGPFQSLEEHLATNEPFEIPIEDIDISSLR